MSALDKTALAAAQKVRLGPPFNRQITTEEIIAAYLDALPAPEASAPVQAEADAELVLVPLSQVERVLEIANRNEWTLDGDALARRVDALRSQPVPAAPAPQVTDETVERYCRARWPGWDVAADHSWKSKEQQLSRRALEAAALPMQGEWQPTHRHKKRGSTYRVIAKGRMQIDGDLDYEKVTIYQTEAGDTWVRPDYEFNDGRFEPLPAPPKAGDRL